MRALRNKAQQEKREAKKLAARVMCKQKGGGLSKCAQNKLPEAVRARLDAAEADVVAAGTEKEELKERVEELEESVKKLYSKLDTKSRIEFDRLRSEPLKGGDGTNLINLLGKEGEEYSQELVELALRLMSSCLSGEQAVSVMRAFVTMLHPDKEEGPDYRIPSAKRLNEIRRYLKPICEHLAVATIRLAVRTHLSSDATTKNHTHILMALYRCELPNGVIVDLVRSIFTVSNSVKT
jgi:polyhydroxyalkanoate synthesis regulator phasin